MISRKVKIIVGVCLALSLFMGGFWLIQKFSQRQTDTQVKAWQDEAGKKAQEALEASGKAAQLAQEIAAKDLEIQEANQRAGIAEARLVEARAARQAIQRAYDGAKLQKLDPDTLAAPITPQERSQLCGKLKDLGKLPESFKCPEKP